ncbi:hypothetical protein Tco_1275202 [Tanacetum coccineum]
MQGSLLQAIEKRFRGNAATKKDLEESSKAALEIHGESSSQEDVNQKFLRSGRWPDANNEAMRVLKTTRRKLTDNGFIRNQENRNRENTRRVVPLETTTSNALVSCDGSSYDWSDQAKEGPTNFALMAYSSTSSNSKVSTDSNCSSSCLENVKILKEQNEQLLKDLRTSKLNDIAYKTGLKSVEARLLVYKKNESVYEEDIKIVDKCKTGLGYNVVPPPYIGNFMPPKHDLSFSELEEFTRLVSIIEDDSVQTKIEKKIVKPSFAKIEFVKHKGKTARKTAKHVEQLRQNTHTPKSTSKKRNNKNLKD